MDSNQYVKEIVKTVKALLNKDDRDLKTCNWWTHSGPLLINYQPELGVTPLCHNTTKSLASCDGLSNVDEFAYT